MSRASCSIEECDRPHKARGWCLRHYRQWLRTGNPISLAPHGLCKDSTLIERFWEKVNKNGPIPPHRPELGPCWVWTASLARGYGSFWIQGVMTGAHRWIYLKIVGPIPQPLELDHLCENKACVKVITDEFGPAHLEPVNHRENLLRGKTIVAINAAKTHCPKGHPYTPDNTYVSRSGFRECRICRKVRPRTPSLIGE
jgi:hypothetical protein